MSPRGSAAYRGEVTRSHEASRLPAGVQMLCNCTAHTWLPSTRNVLSAAEELDFKFCFMSVNLNLNSYTAGGYCPGRCSCRPRSACVILCGLLRVTPLPCSSPLCAPEPAGGPRGPRSRQECPPVWVRAVSPCLERVWHAVGTR